MSAAAFPTTAVPITTSRVAPVAAPPRNDIYAIVRPFVLAIIVAFNIGFVGYLLVARLQAHASAPPAAPSAVETPAAAAPAPDTWTRPTPV